MRRAPHDVDMSARNARVYWGVPEATPERESAWRRWVDDYCIATSSRWIDGGLLDEDAGLLAMDDLLADWALIDGVEWMPLGLAMAIRAEANLVRSEAATEDARQDYMRAVRSWETSTERERVGVVAYQLGVSYQQAQRLSIAARGMAGREKDDAGRTALYRYFDRDGVLLYVGITKNEVGRDEQHGYTSAWHKLAADRQLTWFVTRKEAEAAERQAIRDGGPLFNSTHSSPETKKAAFNYLIKRVAEAEAAA